MKTRTLLCAAGALIVGTSALADGILNGDFEAADPTDWSGSVQNGLFPPLDPINLVELTSDDGVETYARILVATADPGPRAARLFQDFEVCSGGGYLTVTFDARSFGPAQHLVQIGGLAWEIPDTGGAPEADTDGWVRCFTVSVPLDPEPCGEDGVEAMDFFLTYWVVDRVRNGDDCDDATGELHIDNVNSYITAHPMTTLELIEPCLQTAIVARTEVFTGGNGATPPPPCVDVPAGCAADIDHSGAVDFGDILQILVKWGECPSGCCCPADIDRDGIVGFTDIINILSKWGDECP